MGYFSSYRAASCKQCAGGKYNPYTQRSSCTNCAKGRFSSALARTSASHCTVCAVGKYQGADGSTSCISCPVGKHMDGTGATECKLCQSGLYQDQTGKGECKACSTKNPAWVSVPGATSRENNCVCGIDYGTCRAPRGLPQHDWVECDGVKGACSKAGTNFVPNYSFDVRRGRPGAWSYEDPQHKNKRTTMKDKALCSKDYYLYVRAMQPRFEREISLQPYRSEESET